MKRSKTITIRIDMKSRLKGVVNALPEPLFDRLQSVLRRECAVARDHWRKDGGWNLSWRLIEEKIYQEVFGDDLNWYLIGRFLKTGCTWELRTNKMGDQEYMLVKVTTLKRGRVTYKKGRRKKA